MVKKIIIAVLLFAGIIPAIQASQNIENPDKVHALLLNVDISQAERDRLLQEARLQSDQAMQQFNRPGIDRYDAAHLAAGCAEFSLATVGACLAAFSALLYLNDHEFSSFVLLGNSTLATGLLSYFGVGELRKYFTQHHRKNKLINALAIEHMIQTIKQQNK